MAVEDGRTPLHNVKLITQLNESYSVESDRDLGILQQIESSSSITAQQRTMYCGNHFILLI